MTNRRDKEGGIRKEKGLIRERGNPPVPPPCLLIPPWWLVTPTPSRAARASRDVSRGAEPRTAERYRARPNGCSNCDSRVSAATASAVHGSQFPGPAGSVFSSLVATSGQKKEKKTKRRTNDQRLSPFSRGGDARHPSSRGKVCQSTANGSGSRQEKVAFPVASFSRHFSSEVRWPRL
ncbi:hypothetical protein K0M31_015482 [Melipona bicolor]|uniref:Uncharacterized protein n=1 Tax=Melipona bicolor TaxID=60889 RepID=A0AA40FFF7_9HYME|nr:hypothetical protein K0M31_015482 [Melipona bicolor]